MSTQLRMLMVEDEPLDCELLSCMLVRAGMLHTMRRVESAKEMRAEIPKFEPHIILCDFSLPSFDGFQALEIRQAIAPGTPFIFHSGSIGREKAQQALKLGASGYALKGDYANLIAQIRDQVRMED